MPEKDPFATFVSGATLSAVVKNMERRWGLTLVSFLPPEVQDRVVHLQNKVSRLLASNGGDPIRQGRLYIEFYQPRQFHCTHLTLTRSDPSGPIRAEEFVRKGHRAFELFEMIESVSARIRPIKVKLDHLRMATDRFGVVLVGECVSEDAVGYRETLLRDLNQTLPESFNLSRRSWDTDASQFHKLHCSLGYLKRPPLPGYRRFSEDIKQIDFEPLEFAFEDIALVHHRYRTLAFPQRGLITFPLGKEKTLAEDEVVHNVNLA